MKVIAIMYNKGVNSVRLSVLVFLLVLLGSCKTTKNTFLNRNFHNTTTRYNWYFNANESYKSGVKKLQEQNKDDFNQLLSVYPLGTKKEAQSVSPQMDKALKKCATAINKHSMLIKGKEYNRWIDNSYLLIGKSYFYKQEYIKAVEAFRLVSRQYLDDITSYEAFIWLINTYVEMNDFSSADLVIENVLMDETFPQDLNQQLSLALANYHIAIEDYDLAIEELNAAVSLTKKKREKSRYLYILAQLYSMQDNFALATNYFTKVIRTSPDYEMVFNAKINRARSFDTSTGGSDVIIAELQKMLKDDKNKEFLDVIYFGLAELSNRQNKINEAIPLYELSVFTSVKNDAQKALSSVILADIYYDKQNYRPAQAYYDTAVAFMNSQNQRFKNAQQKQLTLTELISNLDIIENQDSLQRIALMPEKERTAFIDDLIRKIEEEERKEKELENQRRSENNFFTDRTQSQNKFNVNQNRGGGWYFDNPNTLSFGFSEFKRKWGKRKLEDNWRRSNKKTLSIEEALADTIAADVFDPKNRDSYMKNLPLTIDAIKASNTMIVEAYFDAGVIYKEQLEDIPQAIKTFETLNDRFPFSENRVMVLYFLHRLHDEKGNIDFADDYKDQLIKEFPNSDYAKLVMDPSYMEELSEANSSLQSQYEQAFTLYNRSKYKECAAICKRVNTKNPNNLLYPNFDFLSTQANAHKSNKNTYMANLEQIIQKYPKHSVAESAKQILSLLIMEADSEEASSFEGDSPYIIKPDAAHYFILLFNDYDLELSIAKSTLSDYHSEYYRLARLNISSLLFKEHTHLITIREFGNQAKAMEYYQAFQNGDVRGVFGGDYTAFVIAGPNFPYFFKNKDVEGYNKMFKENYKN